MIKRFAIIISMFLFLISCSKQDETFSIKGKVDNIPDSTIIDLYEITYDLGEKIGTDTIYNGEFEFSGFAKNSPSKMELRFRDRENYYGRCRLWVDDEKVKVKGNSKYPSSWKVESTNKEQIEFEKIYGQRKDLLILGDSLKLLRSQNRKNKELVTQLKESIDSLGQIRSELIMDYIYNNPNSLSALEVLFRNAKYDKTIDREKVKMSYDNLNDFYKNTLYGEGILETFNENEIPDVGDKMVDFMAYDTAGVNYSLTEFKGKYILLDFWSLACGPCSDAFPQTLELHNNNKEVLTIVSINVFAEEDMWKEKSKEEGICWINLSDGKGVYAGAYSKYGILGLPTYLLINPEGIIVEKWMGYRDGIFEEKLKKHIRELKI
ncbi:TlpA disulfide reductase family protein [uncultured Draconibacterium sp.]|uniref:TlpA disulfide reductase family protein n=1 Tax=uncultured Draconibacterium sp. TaxID=1573823 RepID=UPI002AA8C9B2|nr:TlpA disulfide reductase family protein [uncultured Draconibacterium sp.]